MMMPTRTQAAFEFTVEKLEKTSKRLYFWTFTFREVPINDDWAMQCYAGFMRKVTNRFPDLRGVRVCELHKNHGIHFHALVNVFLPISEVKRIGHPYGFGRMGVRIAAKGDGKYLGKYLTKQYRHQHMFGRRRWGTIGGFKGVRCRDIVYENQATENRELLFGAARVSYKTWWFIVHYTELWGQVANWPAKDRALVVNANGNKWLRERAEREPF